MNSFCYFTLLYSEISEKFQLFIENPKEKLLLYQLSYSFLGTTNKVANNFSEDKIAFFKVINCWKKMLFTIFLSCYLLILFRIIHFNVIVRFHTFYILPVHTHNNNVRTMLLWTGKNRVCSMNPNVYKWYVAFIQWLP